MVTGWLFAREPNLKCLSFLNTELQGTFFQAYIQCKMPRPILKLQVSRFAQVQCLLLSGSAFSAIPENIRNIKWAKNRHTAERAGIQNIHSNWNFEIHKVFGALWPKVSECSFHQPVSSHLPWASFWTVTLYKYHTALQYSAEAASSPSLIRQQWKFHTTILA